MARRRKGKWRVLGPYREDRGRNTRWKLFICSPDGAREVTYAETEAEAVEVKEALEQALQGKHTVEEALVEYKACMERDGKRASTVSNAEERVGRWLPEDRSICSFTPREMQRLYNKRCEEVAVDSHRNELGELKRFFRWCVERRWLTESPVDGVKPTGKRNPGGKGRSPLRMDEARQWMDKAVELAQGGDAGAVAALVCFLCSLRPSEVISLQARDVDDGGRLLWPNRSKTAAGSRPREIAPVLQPLLLKLTEGKAPTDLIFGKHWRDWPRKQVQRICKLAGVQKVSAHSMKGLHGTLAMQAGATGTLVAHQLGHASERITRESYINPGVVEDQALQEMVEKLSRKEKKAGKRNDEITFPSPNFEAN